jgi:hypothetical protein
MFKHALAIACLAATPQLRAAAPSNLETRIAGAVEQLEASLQKTEDAKIDKDFADLIKPYRDRLGKVRSSASPLLKLYRLRDAYVGAQALDFLREHRADAKDLETFRAFWTTQKSRFDQNAPAKQGPFLQTALRQAAMNKSTKLFYASLPYAKVSSPLYGLYYVAEAEGHRRFREFLDTVTMGDLDRSAPKSPDLERAYLRLQTETLAFFEADPASRAVIPVSARLKEARELLDQKTNEAATLALLEARLTLSRQQASKTGDGAEVAAKPTDNTLLSLLLNMAREEDPEVARYIRRDVLPFYDNIMRSRS